MPKRYEAMRDSCTAQGHPLAFCKSKAARIYQKTRRAGEPELNAAVARERRRKR